MKISEGSFSDFKKRFVLDGYGGFQAKPRKCGIDKLDFSIGVKHKKPDPPDFPSGRLFTVSSEDDCRPRSLQTSSFYIVELLEDLPDDDHIADVRTEWYSQDLVDPLLFTTTEKEYTKMA